MYFLIILLPLQKISTESKIFASAKLQKKVHKSHINYINND